MHRVELKVCFHSLFFLVFPQLVPNAPCGVERPSSLSVLTIRSSGVPNAPCGVESNNPGP